MAERDTAGLPDVLGAISGGKRLNVDVIQCAVGLRPSRVPAGQVMEVVLLAQNAADVPAEVAVAVRLPATDAGQAPNRFIVNKPRSIISLRPAEAGYFTIPVSISPNATPAKDYAVQLELSVKRFKGRRPVRMRPVEGGDAFNEAELPQERQDEIWALQQSVFHVKQAGRGTLVANFAVQPSTGKPSPVTDLTARWHSLWTLKEHDDVAGILKKVAGELAEVKPFLKREFLFFPFLDVLQKRFHEAGYPLKAGESVYMAKVLTLVAEQGIPDAESNALGYGKWVQALAHVLLERPEMAKNPRHLVTDLVFEALLHDAVTTGLSMVEAATGEDFGEQHEHNEYADGLLDRLRNGTIDRTHVYLPLVMAGLIANKRVTMPHEQPRETITLLLQAQEFRYKEIDPRSDAVMVILNNLVSQALQRT